jgi:nucleotide-binding universal stress UspA family protein
MHLLCGIDDSAPGRHAAYVAGSLARRLGAELTLMHVVSDGTPAEESRADACGVPVRIRARGPQAAAARTALGELANDVAVQTGARVSLAIDAGEPAPRLAAAAQELGCDLIVIGHTRRGRIGDLLLGEVHGRLIGCAPLPIALVPAGADLPDDGRVVLGCRPSAPPQRAAAFAGLLASRLQTTLVVAQVLPTGRPVQRPTSWVVYDAARRESELATAAAGHEIDVEYAEYDGDPAETLARVADELDAAVIVVGRRRRSPWRRLLRPSFASAVARNARHPVIVVPSAERRTGRSGRTRQAVRASGREPMAGSGGTDHGARHVVLD